MPLWMPPGGGLTVESNLTAAARAGTTITANASTNQKGNYSALIDPTSRPSYGISISVTEVGVGNALQNLLLDIAYGPTGGGNEQVIIPNLNCSNAPVQATHGSEGKQWYFPVYIPSGVRVSGRCQASTSADTCVVAIWLDQRVNAPVVGGLVTDYGTDAANSRGTSVTPGSGAFGNWTQITSSTSRAHRFWAMGMDGLADATMTDEARIVELGVGPDASNVSTIFGPSRIVCETGIESISGAWPMLSYHPVPAGKAIWCRMAAGGIEARGVIVYGVD